MRFVFKEIMRHPRNFWRAVFSMFLAMVVSVIDPVIIIQITNTLNQPNDIKKNLLILILMMVIVVVCLGCNGYYMRASNHHIFNSGTDDLIEKIGSSDMNMFTKYSVANILLATEGCWWLAHIPSLMKNVASQIMTIIAIFGSIWYLGRRVIIPIIIAYIIVGMMLIRISKKFNKLDEKAEELRKIRSQMTDDFIMGFQEFKTFGNAKAYIRKHKKINADTQEAFLTRDKISAQMSFAYNIGNNGLQLLMVLISIYLIANGDITAATGVSMVILVGRIVEPIDWLMGLVEDWSETKAKLKYYKEISEYKNIYDDSLESINIDGFNESIEIKNLKFSYDGSSSNCINDLSMSIKKGEKIGICGLSGAGKSSLFKLLNKFYNSKDGEILVDGIPLEKITDSSWRKTVGVVHQENFIFPGTIKENIVFGTDNYTEHELIEATKSANLYEFIMSLPDKFNTEVGPRGLKLSGGQKQRIAIARLFMKNPQIILLDEATSSLDNVNENAIKNAIDKLSRDKTVITIAHRITTIEHCDRIYVMKGGKIVEQGSYDQLISDQNSEFNRIKEGRA